MRGSRHGQWEPVIPQNPTAIGQELSHVPPRPVHWPSGHLSTYSTQCTWLNISHNNHIAVKQNITQLSVCYNMYNNKTNLRVYLEIWRIRLAVSVAMLARLAFESEVYIRCYIIDPVWVSRSILEIWYSGNIERLYIWEFGLRSGS